VPFDHDESPLARIRAEVEDIVLEMAPAKPSTTNLSALALREQLGFDSLSLVVLYFRLQETFQLELKAMASALADVAEVGDLAQRIAALTVAARTTEGDP
jgi:acyl carrier protein